ncbi:MAG: MarR family winged helix-turn-helix transcriptional regulator [Phycisphaerales bacterium JB047]
MARSLREQIKKEDDFANPEEEAMLNIARTASMIDGAERAFFKRFELTPQAYNLLRILRGHKRRGQGEGVRASEIGGQMVVRVPDVTRLVDRLEDRGMVGRGSCEKDRRVKYVFITEKGMRLLERIDPEIDALGKRVLGNLSERELRTVSRLMEKARDEQPGESD